MTAPTRADLRYENDLLRHRIDQLKAALETLEKWDMLSLDADGCGVATADARWARDLIHAALQGAFGPQSSPE